MMTAKTSKPKTKIEALAGDKPAGKAADPSRDVRPTITVELFFDAKHEPQIPGCWPTEKRGAVVADTHFLMAGPRLPSGMCTVRVYDPKYCSPELLMFYHQQIMRHIVLDVRRARES